ncbi:MAG: phage baseplate assembly protein V, partial [Gemmatimonadetes bacterium]|nr:phage baseplate assembly protein V [Gemmatimonadota bacterium]
VRLAREQGWVTFVRVFTELTIGKTKLFFGPPKKATGGVKSDTTFQVGDRRVRSVRASVTSAGIPNRVAVPGWDDARSKDISGDDSISETDLVTAKINKFPSSKRAGTVTRLETFASTKAQADKAAKGAATRIAGGAIDITMLVRGNPLVKLNRLIEVEDFGDASGIHTVSGISHIFDPSAGGFTTEVLCTGLDDRTLGNLAMYAPPPQRFHGVYPAVVNDINDPKGRGRVKVSLPWLDSTYVTDWCRVLQLGAGKDVGLQFMPRPKDEVVVAFENGQLDSPFVIGSVFGNEAGKIPNSKLIEQGKPMITALTTHAGHQLIFDDSSDSSSITLQVKNGDSCSIVMSDKDGITITTKGDKSLTINSAQDVVVKAGRNATVTAKEVLVDSEGPVKVKGSKIEVSATNITMSASSDLKLTGAQVTIGATANLTLKASGTTTVQGIAVKLN